MPALVPVRPATHSIVDTSDADHSSYVGSLAFRVATHPRCSVEQRWAYIGTRALEGTRNTRSLTSPAPIQAIPSMVTAAAELSRLDGGQGVQLSGTERHIAELVMSGATNGEIARATFLSVKAVEATLPGVYRRLGVRNRARLVRAVQDTDLMPDPATRS